MGWNDVVGNLQRAHAASNEEKCKWCQGLQGGEVGLPRYEDEYIAGTKAAAGAFLNGEPLEYRGPEDIVADLKVKADPTLGDC